MKVITIAVIGILLTWTAMLVVAQEATPPPVLTLIPDEPVTTFPPDLEEENPQPPPDLSALAAVSLGVAFVMQTVKKAVLEPIGVEARVGAHWYGVINMVIAGSLSYVVIGWLDVRINLFQVGGRFVNAPTLVGDIVTAVAVAGGNMTVWSIFKLAQLNPIRTYPETAAYVQRR